MNQVNSLTRTQYDILKCLAVSSGGATIDEIVLKLGSDQVLVFSSLQYMQELGMALLVETEVQEASLAAGIELIREGELPEKTILCELAKDGAALHIQELAARLGVGQKIIGKSLKPMLDKGWILKNGPNVTITENGRISVGVKGFDELVFDILSNKKTLMADEASCKYDFFAEGFELLKKRGQILVVKTRKRRVAAITDEGKRFVASCKPSDIKEEVTALTPDLLQDNKWTNVTFRHYDIQADVDNMTMGRIHPFQRQLNRVRNIFFGMGFSEVASLHIESSFWNFDALFQPQDHPARDMQDTFYLDNPKTSELPDAGIVEGVKSTHENGGNSNSTGWGYKWNVELAKKTVLRTHTTAASIQQIIRTPKPPAKYFCIGRVFRREAIDYKHLPVFTQVDGIVVEKGASLSHLIDILSEFYRKMGFNRIDIRPSFFPYTEPSLEIHVWLEHRKEWVEMGGAGVFRKEVTLPMGCDAPVLAWGLGMERLAMINYNLDDLRKIFISNIKWLREEPSCL
ncbi:MAG TPA: phenylalanine--tRNA ligase subunit alpha [Fibrobacteres bacterium]|nr:phenylalanine--tRNA ligase subunit alpha [Fibrobacterota bacterium]